MSASRFEAFLVRLYVDQSAREKFLADPRGETTKAGLTAYEIDALENIDQVGLELLAQSLKHKRAGRYDRD